MKYLPINLDVSGRFCLIVGGGSVAERKARTLIEAEARVGLVAREFTPGLMELATRGWVQLLGSEYEPGLMEGAVLVFAATSDTGLNARVGREARERGLWVNVADRPESCSFIVPASVVRGDLVIGVSTGGKSPALAARVRSRLEELFGPEYGLFLDLMGRIREKFLTESDDSRENRVLFRQLVDSDLLEALARGDGTRADRVLTEILGPDYTLTGLEFSLEGNR